MQKKTYLSTEIFNRTFFLWGGGEGNSSFFPHTAAVRSVRDTCALHLRSGI